jgi:hypothetical protein
LLCAILNIYGIPSIFIRIRLAIFVRLTEYLKFSNRNPLKLNEKYFRIRKKKPRYFNKKPGLKSFVSIKNRMRSTRKSKK